MTNQQTIEVVTAEEMARFQEGFDSYKNLKIMKRNHKKAGCTHAQFLKSVAVLVASKLGYRIVEQDAKTVLFENTYDNNHRVKYTPKGFTTEL